MDEQRNGEGLEKEGKEEGQRKERCEEESVESLKKRLKEKEEELKELQERLLYLQADFENFKKLKTTAHILYPPYEKNAKLILKVAMKRWEKS